jgi:uncharacterized LabA/DUF88 family protein
VRGVHQGLGDFALQTRQADVEASLEEVSAASCAQVHFGVKGQVSRESDLHFAGRKPHRTDETGKEEFLQWAAHNGFFVVRKEGSPTEEGNYKANVDVLMAIDGIDLAIEMRPDIVVLMTGDADFAHLAHNLRRRGIRVEVAALSRNLGLALKAAANSVIDLGEILNELPPVRGEAARVGGADVFDDE